LKIRGKKSWMIKPLPECYCKCNFGSEMSVIMEKGDIFFVDTRLWNHSSYVWEKDLSISMTLEYQIYHM